MDYEIELKALKLELEREKNKNYILKKENEILMGNIGLISSDQETLINKVKELEEKLSNYENMKAKNISEKNGVKKIIKRLLRSER